MWRVCGEFEFFILYQNEYCRRDRKIIHLWISHFHTRWCAVHTARSSWGSTWCWTYAVSQKPSPGFEDAPQKISSRQIGHRSIWKCIGITDYPLIHTSLLEMKEQRPCFLALCAKEWKFQRLSTKIRSPDSQRKVGIARTPWTHPILMRVSGFEVILQHPAIANKWESGHLVPTVILNSSAV